MKTDFSTAAATYKKECISKLFLGDPSPFDMLNLNTLCWLCRLQNVLKLDFHS